MPRRIAFTICFLFIVLLIIFLTALEIAFSQETEGQFPFSDVINWGEKSRRMKYERSLAEAGIAMRFGAFPRLSDEPRIAESEQCVFFEKDGSLLGYGIIFRNFLLPAYAENKNKSDRRAIDILEAEVLYDLSGQYVFLASYRFRLSAGQMFIAKYIMGQEPEAERRIFTGELDKEYGLDEASKSLAAGLLGAPAECVKQYRMEQPATQTSEP